MFNSFSVTQFNIFLFSAACTFKLNNFSGMRHSDVTILVELVTTGHKAS